MQLELESLDPLVGPCAVPALLVALLVPAGRGATYDTIDLDLIREFDIHPCSAALGSVRVRSILVQHDLGVLRFGMSKGSGAMHHLQLALLQLLPPWRMQDPVSLHEIEHDPSAQQGPAFH